MANKRATPAQTMMNQMYFFHWLEKEQLECEICGIPSTIVASIYQQPFRYWDRTGEWGDLFCQYCYSRISGD